MGWGELKPNKEGVAEKYRWVKRAPGNLISSFHLGLLIKIVHAFQKGWILYSFRMSFPWISQGMARRWIRRQSLAHNQVLSVAIAALPGTESTALRHEG